ERILSDKRVRGKVLSVHSRGAERETILRLAEAGVMAILHGYTGPLELVDSALAAGLYFSVHPAMLTNPHGPSLLDALPRDRVLTETDGPWTPFSGRPAEPS